MYGEKIVNSSGIYGEKGVPNPSNIPSARQYATSTYDKTSDTLWLFGGLGSGKKITLEFINNNVVIHQAILMTYGNLMDSIGHGCLAVTK
jgi:hypothetical protein